MAAAKNRSRCNIARRALIFWCLFVGLGTLGGATGMLCDPSGRFMGMDVLLPYFKALPFADVLFTNYVFSGCALLVVNGLTNLTAAVLLLRRSYKGIVAGMVFGVTLMLWITIQFIIFPANALSTSYFIFGLAQAVTGYAALVFYKQERFIAAAAVAAEQPAAVTNNNELVVYFSRMGYCRAAALREAQRRGCALFEITVSEPTAGTLGFWWCARFGMHRADMPLLGELPPLERYSHVTVCSPIWVFALSSPVRAFCRAAHGRVKQADYVLVHSMRTRFTSASAEMDSLLGITRTGVTDICVRAGKEIARKTSR